MLHQEASGSLLCRPSLWPATAQGLPACSSSMQPGGRQSSWLGPHATLPNAAACRSLGPPAWCPTRARCRAACAKAMTRASASGRPGLSDRQRRLPSAKRSSSASRTSSVQTLRLGGHPPGSNTPASAKQSACLQLTQLEARWAVGGTFYGLLHTAMRGEAHRTAKASGAHLEQRQPTTQIRECRLRPHGGGITGCAPDAVSKWAHRPAFSCADLNGAPTLRLVACCCCVQGSSHWGAHSTGADFAEHMPMALGCLVYAVGRSCTSSLQ